MSSSQLNQSLKQPLVLIKIGGSLLTHKDQAFTLNEKALDLIAAEIKKVYQLDKRLILGHGSGSFAHVPAKKFKTKEGLIGEAAHEGLARVASAAAELNQILINKLIGLGVAAISFPPHAIVTARNQQPANIFLESLEKALELGLLPVVYGDQIFDHQQGCTIFSTETVLGQLALALKNKGYQLEKIIQCGQTNGVYDQNKKTIPLINQHNFADFKSNITGSDGVDVTGGMLHKVEASLYLAEQGIKSLIIDGIEHGTLSRAVKGEKVIGTKVEFSHSS